MTIVELLLIFTASAMASVHCAAMCGGFTLSLVRPGQTGASLVRMAIYHTGKLFTYIFIGAIAGLAGAALLNNPAIRAAQVAFSVTAGVLIVVVGLQTLGLVPGQNLVNRIAARLWLGPFLSPFFKTFREQAGGRGQASRGRSMASPLPAAFFLGLFNGFLPCGLVYSFALAAAGTGSPGAAMLTMLAFGSGTAPVLVAVGWGGAAMAAWQPLRPALARAAGVLVIALGVLTVVRGTPLVTTFAASGGHSSHGHATVTTGATTSTGIDLDPAPAPHFSLINQAGQRVSLHDYHGKVVVLDFIYTSCTTTCPLLTATFQAAQDSLGADFGRTAALVSITVDPATDAPEVLKAFGEKWGADFGGWAFLTGSPAEIQYVTSAYAVYVERTSDGVAHTETIVLIDRRGQLRSVFGLQTDPATIVRKVRELAREP